MSAAEITSTEPVLRLHFSSFKAMVQMITKAKVPRLKELVTELEAQDPTWVFAWERADQAKLAILDFQKAAWGMTIPDSGLPAALQKERRRQRGEPEDAEVAAAAAEPPRTMASFFACANQLAPNGAARLAANKAAGTAALAAGAPPAAAAPAGGATPGAPPAAAAPAGGAPPGAPPAAAAPAGGAPPGAPPAAAAALQPDVAVGGAVAAAGVVLAPKRPRAPPPHSINTRRRGSRGVIELVTN